MKNKILIRLAAISLAAIMAFTPTNAFAATLVKRGSKGSEVKVIQTTLKELGYFTYPKVTGYYGRVTVEAVKRFQRDNGIAADGIVGKVTMGKLSRDTEKETARTLMANAEVATVTTITGGALDWYKEVKDIWKCGKDAVVTDITTGKSFNVKRTYGSNHADIEPLTKADTKVIKDIWGGFSWERRAVTVQIGNYVLAASMTAMPHAGKDSAPANKYISGRSEGYGWGVNLDAVKNNGANGVMDIHFKNSKTHTTKRVLKSQQDMVKKAAEFITKMKNN